MEPVFFVARDPFQSFLSSVLYKSVYHATQKEQTSLEYHLSLPLITLSFYYVVIIRLWFLPALLGSCT